MEKFCREFGSLFRNSPFPDLDFAEPGDNSVILGLIIIVEKCACHDLLPRDVKISNFIYVYILTLSFVFRHVLLVSDKTQTFYLFHHTQHIDSF